MLPPEAEGPEPHEAPPDRQAELEAALRRTFAASVASARRLAAGPPAGGPWPASAPWGVMLGLGVLLSVALQFGSKALDGPLGLPAALTLANVGLAAGWARALAREPQGFWRLVAWVAAGSVALGACLATGMKLQARRALAGTGLYAAPHQPFRYPAEARTLELRTADGVPLTATLLTRGLPRAVVIYPGWHTDRRAFAIVSLAGWLSDRFDVLVLDPRGQGESGGAKHPDGRDAEDVLAGVAALQASGHRRIGVLGEQDGAYPALVAASRRTGIDALALLAPTRVWGESLGTSGRMLDPRGLMGRLAFRVSMGLALAPGTEGPDARNLAAGLSPTPLLVLTAVSAPGRAADALYASAGQPKGLVALGGEGRPLSWERYAAYTEALREFFELTLVP